MKLTEYEEFFTPSAPVETRRLLFGREQEIVDLGSALRRKGYHPVVTGSRGVGKTSLVHIGVEQRPHIFVACTRDMAFSDLCQSILEQLGAASRLSSPYSDSGTSSGSFGAPRFTAGKMFDLLREIRRDVAVVIDEYDLIPSGNTAFHASVADLLKLLSDHSKICPTRIIVVGVGRSAQDLLAEHDSIARCAIEIYLRPLKRQHVRDFLRKAEGSLHFRFDPAVAEKIVIESGGFPYYVHVIGLHCIDQMIARKARQHTVTQEDYLRAQQKAADQAFRSVLGRWRNSLRQFDQKEVLLLKEVISFDSPYPARREVVERLQKGGLAPNETDLALTRLERDRRIVWVDHKHKEQPIRFHDPLLRLFLRARIFPRLSTPTPQAAQMALFEESGEDEEAQGS